MNSQTNDLTILYRSTDDIKLNKRNARTHSPKQIHQIARSIEEFGFTNPVLIDEGFVLIAGHGRHEAARSLGLEAIPTIMIRNLSQSQKRALTIADNKLALNAGWDIELLSGELLELSAPELDFDLSLTGFDTPEIDQITIRDDENTKDDADDVFADVDHTRPAITKPGDIWNLGNHRIMCGDALVGETYHQLLQGELAEQVITDPPYNVPIKNHVSGLGKACHDEFAMASGEMSREAFKKFLTSVFVLIARHSNDGAIIMAFMDWRHIEEIVSAGDAAFDEYKNMIVWDKVNGGMGSLYRSQHELLFVFKSGKASHINNIELGRHGRYRTNIWRYPGAAMFRKGREEDLAMHPTVKPVGLLADAIKDCSKQNGLILDPFAGSGSIILAAERTGRRARCIEIDPHYVDTVVKRWQDVTGGEAVHALTGMSIKEYQSSQIETPEPEGV